MHIEGNGCESSQHFNKDCGEGFNLKIYFCCQTGGWAVSSIGRGTAFKQGQHVMCCESDETWYCSWSGKPFLLQLQRSVSVICNFLRLLQSDWLCPKLYFSECWGMPDLLVWFQVRRPCFNVSARLFAQQHLQRCEETRTKLQELQATLASASRTHHAMFDWDLNMTDYRKCCEPFLITLMYADHSKLQISRPHCQATCHGYVIQGGRSNAAGHPWQQDRASAKHHMVTPLTRMSYSLKLTHMGFCPMLNSIKVNTTLTHKTLHYSV